MSEPAQNNVLLNICQTQDNRIHSKNGLFSHILKAQPRDLQQLKQDIVKLSYSVKCVAIQNGEIGILSKRMPLRIKEKAEAATDKAVAETERYNREFVVHKTFFSNPLQVVRKPRKQLTEQEEQKQINQQNQAEASADKNNISATDCKVVPSTGKKSLSQSLKNTQIVPEDSPYAMKTPKYKPSFSGIASLRRAAKSLRTIPRKQTFTPIRTPPPQTSHPVSSASASSNSAATRSMKSYSQLLGEIHSRNTLKLQPLQSDNRMLEQLRKISNLTKVQVTANNKMSKIAYLKNANIS